MKRGRFITLEGCEGVGKSTNLQFIESILKQNQIDVVVTREPGGTPLAEEIRELILSKREEQVHPLSELLLIFAARAQHLKQFILPNLQSGKWVLCDRFTDATYAYQGQGRNLSFEVVSQLENLVQDDLRPDLTVLLDIDVEVGLQRASERGELDRFEIEPRDFFQTVREAYLTRAREDASRFAIIDAAPALADVQKNIQNILEQFIAAANSHE